MFFDVKSIGAQHIAGGCSIAAAVVRQFHSMQNGFGHWVSPLLEEIKELSHLRARAGRSR